MHVTQGTIAYIHLNLLVGSPDESTVNQMSGRNGLGFTPKQGQYLAFIDAYTRVNRRPPAEWEMQRHFGVTPPSVHQMILTLERAGFIRRQPRIPRSIEVLVPPEKLPVLQAPA
jgi:DNA-binding MarR family transcriptional regulator